MGVIMQAFYWDCPQIEGIPFGWWAHLQAKVPELAAAGFAAPQDSARRGNRRPPPLH